MKKVVGIGNSLIDLLIHIEDERLLDNFNLKKGGMWLINADIANAIVAEITPLNKTFAPGGSAGNTISALARLGISTSFIGILGSDEYGDRYYNSMSQIGVAPLFSRRQEPTGFCTCFVTPDGERTMATHLGAAATINENDLCDSYFCNGNILYAEGYLVINNRLIETTFSRAKQMGMQNALDLASYNVVETNNDFLHKLVNKYVDIVFANEEEALAYTNKSPEQAVDEISRNADITVVKIGKKGSIVKAFGKKYHIDPIDVECVDTTGAGDNYAAGFLYGLINNASFENCGYYGSLLSSTVIEQIGPRIPENKWNLIKEKIVTPHIG